MKICSQCKLEKPFEAFWREKKAPDGYRSSCAECDKLRKLELKKNPLMQLEKQIRSSVILENKLLQRENKRLCAVCREIFLIDDLVSNGAFCKECSRKKSKEDEAKKKEKRRDSRIKYYEKNKEKNKEKIKEKNRKYYEKKKLEKQNNT